MTYSLLKVACSEESVKRCSGKRVSTAPGTMVTPSSFDQLHVFQQVIMPHVPAAFAVEGGRLRRAGKFCGPVNEYSCLLACTGISKIVEIKARRQGSSACGDLNNQTILDPVHHHLLISCAAAYMQLQGRIEFD